MGFRFRKSVKIAPGVRLNFGKKSASVSIGGKGVRHTVSTTGRHTSSVGIPGSGLSYTTSSSAKQRSSTNQRNTYISANNNYSNPATEVDNFNLGIKRITSLHKCCEYSYDWNEVGRTPSPLNSENRGTNEIEAINKLNSYQPGFLASKLGFLKSGELEKLEQNILTSREKDQDIYSEWKNLNEISKMILRGNINAYTDLMSEKGLTDDIAQLTKSFDFRVWNNALIVIDYDINIHDIIPESYKTITNAGNLSIRKYSKTDYYDIVKDYVSSLALHVARNTFGLLPLHTVVINTNINELDTQTGNRTRSTILSIKIDKSILQSVNLNSALPFDALNNFEHNVKFLKTKGFQSVEKVM